MAIFKVLVLVLALAFYATCVVGRSYLYEEHHESHSSSSQESAESMSGAREPREITTDDVLTTQEPNPSTTPESDSAAEHPETITNTPEPETVSTTQESDVSSHSPEQEGTPETESSNPDDVVALFSNSNTNETIDGSNGTVFGNDTCNGNCSQPKNSEKHKPNSAELTEDDLLETAADMLLMVMEDSKELTDEELLAIAADLLVSVVMQEQRERTEKELLQLAFDLLYSAIEQQGSDDWRQKDLLDLAWQVVTFIGNIKDQSETEVMTTLETKNYSANCDLLSSYHVAIHEVDDQTIWKLFFFVKRNDHADVQQQHYILRYKYISLDGIPHRHDETRFIVVPHKPSGLLPQKQLICIDHLDLGYYNFQICTTTNTFKPNFLDIDDSGFSWKENAPTYKVRLEYPTMPF